MDMVIHSNYKKYEKSFIYRFRDVILNTLSTVDSELPIFS